MSRTTTSEPWQRNDRLASTLRILFPEPAQISTPGVIDRSPRGSSDYLVIPSVRNPKLVLPSKPHHVTAAGVRNYRRYSSLRDRLKRQVLSAAVRTGAGALLCDRIRVTAGPATPDPTIDRYLAGRLDRNVRIGLHIGPARAVQKPVLQVMTEAGETFAFAKIGNNPFTRALVSAESTSLMFLNSVGWDHLVVPPVLHHGQWDGHEVLVVGALTSTGSPSPDRTGLAAAMVELARCRGTSRHELGSSPYRLSLETRLDELPRSSITEWLRRALGAVMADAGTTLVELGSWHGDWTPWNMTSSGTRTLVWDWEMFESGVPLGLDAVHCAVQRSVATSGSTPVAAFADARRDGAALLAPFGVAAAAASTLVTLYAIEIALRYLADGELDAGTTPMTRLSSWLPEVLAPPSR